MINTYNESASKHLHYIYATIRPCVRGRRGGSFRAVVAYTLNESCLIYNWFKRCFEPSTAQLRIVFSIFATNNGLYNPLSWHIIFFLVTFVRQYFQRLCQHRFIGIIKWTFINVLKISPSINNRNNSDLENWFSQFVLFCFYAKWIAIR